MTMSDFQETTLMKKQGDELGLIGAIQMFGSIAFVVYVYLVYGLRLNLKKGGLYYTLRAR